MNIENKVKVTICGKEYNLRTDEAPEYLTNLAKRVDKEIYDLVKAKPNFGIQNAAIFVALTSLDEAQKASDSIENIRKQIKTYMTEAAKARREKEKLADKNKALEEKLAALEKENKELKKRPPQFDCEQLVLENTITPAVTVYAEEISPDKDKEQSPEEQASEEKPDREKSDQETSKLEEPAAEQNEISPSDAEKNEAPAQTAECGSDASKGAENIPDGENGGTDGGAGAEAQNDGSDTQNADVTSYGQSRKSRKKRR